MLAVTAAVSDCMPVVICTLEVPISVVFAVTYGVTLLLMLGVPFSVIQDVVAAFVASVGLLVAKLGVGGNSGG